MTPATKTAAPKKSSKGKTAKPFEHNGTRIALTEDATLLGTIAYEKGRDIIVISVSAFNEKTSLDVRRFYMNEDTESYNPTPKGVRIPIGSALEVVDLLHDQRSLIASLEN